MFILRLKIFFGRFILKLIPLQAFPKINRCLYKFMGHQIGDDVLIYSSVEIVGLVNLSIGTNSFIGHKSLIMGGKSRVVVGKNCDISSSVSLITGTHIIGNEIRRAGSGFSKNILIGDGVWIGYGATILGGVEIGHGAVVAAGSLVNKSVPPNVIVGGIPAKTLKFI